MKNILIIANFCRDFSQNDNGRFMYLCKELSKNNNVEIVTSDFRHSTKTHKPVLSTKWPFKITFIHESGYKKNISIKRFISHYLWGKKVGKYLNTIQKPDVIYCSIPSLTAPLKAARFCEKNKIKFIIDIQDLWPEAFQMVFNVPIISKIIFYPFKKIADSSYKKADVICSVSETYGKRAYSVNHKTSKIHTVFLGTKLEVYDENAKGMGFCEKNDGEIWLGYCGSLSTSYDLKCVIDALKLMKTNNQKCPKFIIMGDGAKKEEYEKYAKERKINFVFTGRLNYDEMCATLSKCDIVINPIAAGSAASIINKHGDYAASGCPVVNTQENEEYRKLIEKYNMGINCRNEDFTDVYNAILLLMENSDLRHEMGKNARQCAKEMFDRKKTYIELIDCILEDEDN